METHRISCKNIPNIFFEEKNVAKDHFRQFGRIKKMIFKPKSRICTVEYANQESLQKAIDLGCMYENHVFEIIRDITLEKMERSKKENDPEWLPDPDVLEELNAMGGGPSFGLAKKYNLRPEVMDIDTKDNPKNVHKRQWPISEMKNSPKKSKSLLSLASLSEEQQELIEILKRPAHNIDEKYKCLDARDKLIRFLLKREGNKNGATMGICPDMCPEKERLLRVIQHQVSIYEQDSSKEMNEALAVKQYSRSSADQEAPLPHELRPVAVLQMTMSYLVHRMMNFGDTSDVNIGDWYHFLWDRTRSIRKDITQQELCSLGSVALVEQCARFHIHCSARLVAEEPSVFDQKINTENLTKCLQTLKYMYNDLQLKGEVCPNEAEFRAYIILLNLNDGNFMWEVQKLKAEIQKSQEVKTAIEIYSALDKNNFIKFFKLVNCSSYLNACILMRYFMQVRIRAITILLKCYTPRITKVTYPLDKLTANLDFESISHTMEFLQSCGLTINTSRTGVILDKKNFTTPDFTYTSLDRSINVVESKRKNVSVGQIICHGELLPAKNLENHVPQNSFNDGNTLKLDQYQELKNLINFGKLPHKVLIKIEKHKGSSVQTKYKSPKTKNPYVYVKDTQESIASKPFKFKEEEELIQKNTPIFSSVKSSIFSLENGGKIDKRGIQKVNIFGGQSFVNLPVTDDQKLENISNELTTPSKDNYKLFQNSSKITDNSETKKNDFENTIKNSESLFKDPKTSLFGEPHIISKPASSIFGQPNQFDEKLQPKMSIFGNTNAIFENQADNIGKAINLSSEEYRKNETDFNEIKWDLDSPEKCINPRNTVEDIFFKSSNSQTLDSVQNILSKSVGGFSFPNFSFTQLNANKNQKSSIIPDENSAENEKLKIQKDLQKKIEAEREKLQENEQINKLDIERKITEKKRKEESQVRKIREEEIVREFERKEFEEIKVSVEKLIPEILEKVDEFIRMEKIEELKKKIQKRILLEIFEIWRKKVLKIKKKRKALACSPLWTCSRSPGEEARELRNHSQNLTLKNMKRYKFGRSLTLACNETKLIEKIDFKELTDVITRRYCELGFKFFKGIFWKGVISLPGFAEMPEGRRRIDEALEQCIKWKNSNGETVLLEEYYLNPVQSVKFCIERQSEFKVKYCDANGFIFIAKNYNQALCRRILENVKDFGVFVRLPIVIILEEQPPYSMNLSTLVEEGIISNYLVVVDNFSPDKIVSNVQNSLRFLVKNAERPPPLELDTMKAFLIKHLCTEIWRRANSFCKWNSVYKNCLRNPNVVIFLYNDAITRLRNLILNKSCYEFASFPTIFKELLPSEIPDSLPCDYKYFPVFCKEESYFNCLSLILRDLELPPIKSWPPKDQIHLEKLFSEYITNSFKDPQKPFYKILSVFLNHVESACSFEEIRNVVWTDIIETLALEKIHQFNFSLEDTKYFNKSVFNQLVVIYNPESLKKYSDTDWFYVSNPIIKTNIEENSYMPWEEKKQTYNVTSEEIDEVISNAESKIENLDHRDTKNDFEKLKNLLFDLEESLLINKKITSNLNERLITIVKDD